MELILNGQTADLSDFEADELAQAVLISLFSWRKSADDDGVKAPARQGWWGDTFASISGDRIGSRLVRSSRLWCSSAQRPTPKKACNGSSMMRSAHRSKSSQSAAG